VNWRSNVIALGEIKPTGQKPRSTETVATHVVELCSLGESCSMPKLVFPYFAVSFLLILSGCMKSPAKADVVDACSLLSKEDVESMQAVGVNETKSSKSSNGMFLISQCFYTAAESNKSVNLALIRNDPTQRSKRSPKDFWKEKFGSYEGDQMERDEKSEKNTAEKEEGPAPKKIIGLGDEAFWVSNRFGGVLYVLKGDAFMSIGLGGTDDEDTKLSKSKALAQKALQRLK